MLYKTLNNGVRMPMLGLGVYQMSPNETERCVLDALKAGYRLIDTAQSYNNEEGVGTAIAKSGVPRDQIFVTSKVQVSNMNYERARYSIDRSLRKLRTDHIDLMLLHQMMGDYTGAWRAMEEAYEAGKLRAIGVSNCHSERLVDMALMAEVPPMVNQIETNPFCQRDDEHFVMDGLSVIHESWAPFYEGRQGIFSNPILSEIARSHGKTVAQVILRALIQKDIVVIPKTTHLGRMEENLDVFGFSLTRDDMRRFEMLEDPNYKKLFDHRDVRTVKWLLGEIVKKQQLRGGTLY